MPFAIMLRAVIMIPSVRPKISTSGVMEKDVNLSIAMALKQLFENRDRKSTRLNSSHGDESRMPSSA